MTASHNDLARRLRDAYAGGSVPPLRDGLDPTDVDGAYAVQTINTRYWEAQGRRIVGRKAGLTAKAVQTQLGVDQPDFGVLFEDMRVADGGNLDPAKTLQPKAEAEIAFILGADLLDPDTTVEQVAAAIATVHAAIEIVDSRIADWKMLHALLADGRFHILVDRIFGIPDISGHLDGRTSRPTAGSIADISAVSNVASETPPFSFWSELPQRLRLISQNSSTPSEPPNFQPLTKVDHCVRLSFAQSIASREWRGRNQKFLGLSLFF